ncbi:MAG: NAD-dependent epimerase/dehydratase family protein [Phycisphaerales bacterium]|nr:MAG: NAD-dependent epimerase/dehydratase family protein [Phycisphaerales bacterium]
MPDQPTTCITGIAGFIGSHLAERLLADGHRVVGIDNYCDFYDPRVKHGRVRHLRELADRHGWALGDIREADIRDREAVFDLFRAARPDRVVHIAAMAGVRPSIENPKLYTEVNLDGTVNVLDAAVEAGVQKLAFASSSSVYGNNPKVPFAETDAVDHPISPYAATKKAGELYCHAYAHLHALPIACLRFFTVFGPRQRPDLAISKFMRMIDAGEPIPVFGDGSTSRDYTYIDDIVTGITQALDAIGTEHRYRVWNLGGSSPVTLAELIAAIERAVGKKAVIERKAMQPGDVERTFADISRSRAEIGYEPKNTLAEGLAQQWAWLSAEGIA